MRRGSALALASGLIALATLVSGASVASAQTFQLTSCAATELRAAVTTANSNNQDDTISLKPGCTYVSTSVLPVQADGGHSLTVVGHGDTKISEGGGSYGIFLLPYGSPASLTVQGVTLTDFVAGSGAGAITDNDGGTVKLLASTISHGQGCGGGIYSNRDGSTVTVSYSTISDTGLGPNCNSSGISMGQSNSTLLINNSTITRNVANGGILVAGAATIIASTISDNTGSDAGGIRSFGSLHIYASTISGNTATGNNGEYRGAGGLEAFGPTWITDSTITQNTGTSAGGIFACCGGATATKLLWSTVAGNTASISGRGGADLATDLTRGGRISLKASIVAGNSANGPDCAPNTVVYDFGYNLADDGSCPLDTSRHSRINTPAGLDPNGLQDNGGPTQTIALMPGSPGIDFVPVSVGPPTQDQRILPRPDSGESFTDIGAYETQDG